jgi:YesN/AraC family two-component response regulator
VLLKVVIIDDNPLIIQSLEETIDWHSLSCEVVGKSTSGETGRRIIKKLMPEIIISDIRMPGIDGLDMIEFIKPVVPNAKVIVISGYEDFEYANRAIKIGVSDYILKPINNDELSKTIKKVADEIFDHQNENKLKTTIIKENLEHSKNLEHMKYLKKLSVLSNVLNYSEYDNNEIKRIFEREKIHFKAFLVIAVTVRDSQEENSGILERINDLKLKIEDIEIFSLLAGSYVVCFVFFIKKIPRHPKNIAIKLYEQLKIAYSNAEIYITSTGIYTEASDITSAFEEARLLLRKVLVISNRC